MAAAKVDNHSRGDEFIASATCDHFDSVILRPCGGSREKGRRAGRFVGKITDGKIGFPVLGHLDFDRLASVRIEQQSSFSRAAFYCERVAILLLDLGQAEVAGFMQAKKVRLISELEVLEFLVGDPLGRLLWASG